MWLEEARSSWFELLENHAGVYGMQQWWARFPRLRVWTDRDLIEALFGPSEMENGAREELAAALSFAFIDTFGEFEVNHVADIKPPAATLARLRQRTVLDGRLCWLGRACSLGKVYDADNLAILC